MTWDWNGFAPRYAEALGRLGLEPPDDVLLASLGEKKLLHFRRLEGGEWTGLGTYAISSGRRPPSCQADSLGTPLGLHAIAEKIGQGALPGMVFVSRQPTGERYTERDDFGPDQRMLVTTRILRLEGLEPGLNRGPGIDSYERYIYIHGTTHPERFPENLSAGCITLLDTPLIALFEATPVGSHLWIES